MGHIKGFDGVRAIAAFSVLGFHLQLPGFSLGWLGVHLFFVLSGYLITRILLAARDDPDCLQRFYWNRSVRIFPIYFLTLAAVTVWTIWKGVPSGEVVWNIVYLQNWRMALGNNDVPLLAHAWTLAIEEQFYLLWPLAVLCLSRRSLLLLSIGIVLAAPAFRLMAVIGGGDHWMVSAPTTNAADTLVWGALAASMRESKTATRALLVCGLTAFAFALPIAVAGILAGRASPDVQLPSIEGGVVFLSLVGPVSLFLLLCIETNPALAHLLDWQPLRYCGQISYGLYLYHFPIFAILAAQWPMKVAVTLFVAALSFELIERPLKALRAQSKPNSTGWSRSEAK